MVGVLGVYLRFISLPLCSTLKLPFIEGVNDEVLTENLLAAKELMEAPPAIFQR